MRTATTVSVPRDVTTFVDRFITVLGGREKANAAAGLRVIAEGERNHPGWGFGPEAPEKVADFAYTLVEDSVASRYRIAIKSHTYLVPADLDYVEISTGSAGHLTGIDFMFDPRPVDVPIPSWRASSARQSRRST